MTPLRNPQQAGEPSPAELEQSKRAADVPERPFDFSGPWFDARTAAKYLCRPTVKAYYEWCRRHGIVRQNGLAAKADLDRARRVSRSVRRIHPNSLKNLRLRRR